MINIEKHKKNEMINIEKHINIRYNTKIKKSISKKLLGN